MYQVTDGVWGRWSRVLAERLPYLTLAISTILALVQPGSWGARAGTAALAALAAAWISLLYSRAPEPRDSHRLRMMLYFTGLLSLGALLMSRHSIFLVFAATGFIQAALLKPRWLMVLGVAATSILINTITTGFPWTTSESWFIFTTIIVIQTLAFGFGTVVTEKLSELNRQRGEAILRLEEALAENAGLQAQLLAQARETGILEERQRMAREIHDTLAQGLTGIITQLEAAEQAGGRPAERQRHLDNAARLARESLSEARRFLQAAPPESLERTSLPEALAQAAEQWSAMNEIPLKVTVTGTPLRLHPEIEMALLRTAQEALANVARHARASRAGVTLSYMGDVVTLDVRDDGVGFKPEEAGAGFGLVAMRQRLGRVAGALEVESEPGGGTAISARVPAILAQSEKEEA